MKLHADQLSDGGGAELAARFGALSADHLEYTSAAGVAAMAQAGTVAVLLPGAFYALRERQRPPVAEFRRAGVRMAVATDCNPGSSPMASPLLAMNMAAVLFGMTVEECLRGMTVNAAHALGMQDDVGALAVGMRADLAIWQIAQPAELIYWIGGNPLWRREFAG
jgi:imidazolonepropionase